MQGLEIKEKDRIQTADEFLQKLTEEEKPIYQGDETVTMLSEDVKKKYGDALAKAEAAEVTAKQEISAKAETKAEDIPKKTSADKENEKTKKQFNAKIIIPIVVVLMVIIAVTTVRIFSNSSSSEPEPSADLSQADFYNQAVEYENNGEKFKAICSYFDANGYKDSVKRLRKLLSFNISGGSAHTVGLKNNGKVVATGYKKDSRCDVSDWSGIASISASGWHTVGLKSNSKVVAVGNNDFGQCDVDDWKKIVAVSAGSYHTVGLKSDGTVVATGDNENGQCNVTEWENIVEISAGYGHSIGLKSDGTVVATEFIKSDDINYDCQCDVSEWTDIVAVSAGACHTVGLKSDGTVVTTGNNDFGQCDVFDWTDIVAIYTGDYHTLGLKSDGTVVATGDNENGQCNVTEWKNIVEISAGYGHSIGLKSDGTVVVNELIESDDYLDYEQADVSKWKNIRLPYETDDEKTTERKGESDNKTVNQNVTKTTEEETTKAGKNKKTNNIAVGDIIKFGSYEQDNNESNGKEDIEWRVLAKKDNKVFVISEYALDSKPYNTEATDVTWETCSLRKWLNDDFLNNAFDEEEQKKIQITNVTADNNPEYDTDPGNDTKDKVFLLSITEADKYFSSNEERECLPTAYTLAQGAMTDKSFCWWWLRTPGNSSGNATGIFTYGDIYYNGCSVGRGNHDGDDNGSIRPAMWISIDS